MREITHKRYGIIAELFLELLQHFIVVKNNLSK